MAASTPYPTTTTLLIIPLLTSSLTLFYAIIEPTIFIPFLRSASNSPKPTSRALHLWWTHFYYFSLGTIISLLLPTIISSSSILLTSSSLPPPQRRLIATGLTLTIAHLSFGPWIVPEIDAMCDPTVEAKGETVSHLRKWLKLHYWRTLFTDLPAWVCFAWAVFGV